MAENKDLLYLDKIYPEAAAVFSETYKSVEDIIKDAIIVLDTNVLLVLFDASEKNVTSVKNIYLKYKSSNSLFIPSRVAREFANNRANRIGNVFFQIRQIKEKLNSGLFKVNNYPLLEHNNDYNDLLKEFKVIQDCINKSRKYLDNIETHIQSWNWNDNVSAAYKEVFTSEIIIDLKESDKLLEDLQYRITHKIAPGYKDEDKIDNGIGDLIIWKTLLEIAKEKNRDLVFVTNEQKNDWFYKQDKIGLYPKYELFDEFRRVTMGKSIAIINFIKFLELSSAKPETIDELKTTIQDMSFDGYQSDIKEATIGMSIEHNIFGKGIVVGLRPHQDTYIATIDFENFGMKELMLKYAKLKIIDAFSRKSCSHPSVERRINGIYDDWVCTTCNSVINRQFADDLE